MDEVRGDEVRSLSVTGPGGQWIPVVDSSGKPAVVNAADAETKYLCSAGGGFILRAILTPEEAEVEKVRPGGGFKSYYLSQMKPPKSTQRREARMFGFVDGTTQCVVAMAGWVFVGVAFNDDGPVLRLEQAVCVRRWGTKYGLGELRSGPVAATICDPYGTVRMPADSVVATIELSGPGWAATLGAVQNTVPPYMAPRATAGGYLGYIYRLFSAIGQNVGLMCAAGDTCGPPGHTGGGNYWGGGGYL